METKPEIVQQENVLGMRGIGTCSSKRDVCIKTSTQVSASYAETEVERV